MTILAQVYSGHTTDDPLIPCLEISSPAFAEPIRNCAGFEDQTVTLEGGGSATFIASGLDVALPARDDSGQQNLRFAIENVTGEVMLAIDAAMAEGAEVTLVYREYRASDLSAPARRLTGIRRLALHEPGVMSSRPPAGRRVAPTPCYNGTNRCSTGGP